MHSRKPILTASQDKPGQLEKYFPLHLTRLKRTKDNRFLACKHFAGTVVGGVCGGGGGVGGLLYTVTTASRVRKQKHLHRSGRFTSSGHVVYYRTTTTSPRGSGNESNKTIPMGVG